MIDFIKDLSRYRIKVGGELFGFLLKANDTRWSFTPVSIISQMYIFSDEFRQIADKLDELNSEE